MACLGCGCVSWAPESLARYAGRKAHRTRSGRRIADPLDFSPARNSFASTPTAARRGRSRRRQWPLAGPGAATASFFSLPSRMLRSCASRPRACAFLLAGERRGRSTGATIPAVSTRWPSLPLLRRRISRRIPRRDRQARETTAVRRRCCGGFCSARRAAVCARRDAVLATLRPAASGADRGADFAGGRHNRRPSRRRCALGVGYRVDPLPRRRHAGTTKAQMVRSVRQGAVDSRRAGCVVSDEPLARPGWSSRRVQQIHGRWQHRHLAARSRPGRSQPIYVRSTARDRPDLVA